MLLLGIYQHSICKWRPEHASSIPANVLPAQCSSLLAPLQVHCSPWPGFKRKGATFGVSQPASCWFTFFLHFKLHDVLPRCPGCGEGVKLSTVWMWPGCYSIIGTSSLQAWLQGKEKASASMEVCHFVSLFTGGGLLGSAPWTLSSVAIACPLPSSFKTWLGDMVLKEWQPWL